MLKKFKQWLKYDTPHSGTADDWHKFDTGFKDNAPIRYWLKHTLPYKTWKPITRKWEAIGNWVRYRIVRYHVVNTGLPPDYYDKDTLMMYSNFTLLKDYVEMECASMAAGSDNRKSDSKLRRALRRIQWNLPFYTTVRELTGRSRELGLKHLEWEMTLDDPDLDPDQRSPHQAAKAREVYDLYLWWVDVRTAEPDEEGFPAIVEEAIKDKSIMYIMSSAFQNEHPIAYKAYREWSSQNTESEEYLELLDEENLIRLIKLRKSLWT